MKHTDCGGEVLEDKTPAYPYDSRTETGSGPPNEWHPALICQRCGAEILGDDALEVTE